MNQIAYVTGQAVPFFRHDGWEQLKALEGSLRIRRGRPMVKDRRTAAKHVKYEIEMLIFAGDQLGGRHSSPITMPPGNEENMALDCFLLHFRNLRAFLCPKDGGTHEDDICASEFLDKSEATYVADRKTLERDKPRLDKMLAHLSYARETFIETRNAEWPVARMSIDMLEQLEVFLGLLSPEERSWFPSAIEISERKSRASGFLEDGGSTPAA
jgi:hypothetical protein